MTLPASPPPRILAVDDEPMILHLIRRTLRDFEVIPCQDPREALSLLRQGDWDLLVTDLRMPGITGLELIRRARRILPDLPCLILTAYADLEIARKALELGAYALLTKPFSAEELEAAIQQALRRRLDQEARARERALLDLFPALRRLSALPSVEEGMRRAVRVMEEHLRADGAWIQFRDRELRDPDPLPDLPHRLVFSLSWGQVGVVRRAPFGGADREVARLLAQHLEVALEGAAHLEAEVHRARQLALVHRAAMAFARTLDLEQLLQEAVEATAEVLGCDLVAILTLEEGRWILRSMAGDKSRPQRTGSYTQPREAGVLGRLWRTRQVQWVPDTQRDPDYIPPVYALVPMRSELAVPLFIGGELFGALDVEDLRPYAFGAEDRQVFEVLAAHLSQALENAALFSQLQQRLQEIEALLEMAQEINRPLELSPVLNRILGLGIETTRASRGALFVAGPEQAPWLMQAHGDPPPFCPLPHFLKEMTYVGEMERDRWFALPLRVEEETVGALLLALEESPMDPAQRRFLSGMAEMAGMAVRKARLLEETQRNFFEVLVLLAALVEEKDAYTREHVERVAAYSVAIGRAMGVEVRDLQVLYLGGILHDIGKVGIQDSILSKPGPLTPEEFEAVRIHPVAGYQILKSLSSLSPVLPLILYHQERWDGSGYPYGLRGREIPLLARILAVADVIDALSTDRPYRRALPKEEVMEILRQEAGVLWDPRVVQVALDLLAGWDLPLSGEEVERILEEVRAPWPSFGRKEFSIREPIA